MAAPSFVQASAGATDAGGAWSFTAPIPQAVNNLIIFDVIQDGTTVAALTINSGSNIKDIAGTNNAWTALCVYNDSYVGQPSQGWHFIYAGWATSTSAAPTIGGSNSTSEDLYALFYEFTDVKQGTTLAEIIENGTIQGMLSESLGTSASITDASVETLGPDRLAVNLIAISDDNTISAFTGGTGGDWVLAASYANSSGTDASIGLQIARANAIWNNPAISFSSSIYGGTGTGEQVAQSFTSPASATTLTAVNLYVGKTGTLTDDQIVEIQTDASGSPSGTVVASAQVAAASIPDTGWWRVSLNVALSASTSYWIVVRRTGTRDVGNCLFWSGPSSSTYAGGIQKTRNNGAWSSETNDLNFGVETSAGATIDGGSFTQADGSDGWNVIGFAIIGTTVAGPTEYTDSATTTVDIQADGTEYRTQVYADTDTDRVSLTPSTTEVHEIPDSASLLVDLQASGTELQAKLYTDSDTDRISLTPSHVEIHEIPDSATVYVDIQVSTTVEVAVFVDSATPLVDLQADGSELKAHDYPDTDTALVDIQASTTAEDHTTFDSATVGNLLTLSADELKAHDYSDADTPLVDLQAIVTAEEHATYDAETAPVVITPSGSDTQETSATEWTDSDTATVDVQASSVELQEFVESATAPVALSPSSTEEHTTFDATTTPVALSVSDVQVAELVDAATTLVDIEASSADVMVAVDNAETLIDIQASGADIAILEDVNTIPLSIQTTATEEHTTYDSETVSELLSPSFTEVHEIADATTATLTLTPDTADIHEIPDATTITNVLSPLATEEHTTYDDATSPLSLAVSGTEGVSSEYLDADTALVDIQAEATELAEFVDSDTSTVDIQASGEELAERADAAETVEVITPSGADIFEGIDAETVLLVLSPSSVEYMPQILRPNADVDANNWQVVPLWEKVSDVNDSTYIYATAT